MSGDVQPRKRRDKKKKKDELEETTTHHFTRAPTPPTSNDDVNIHIYKESSTGGGICAKFVFFVLLAILGTLIGLIITEHRGLTHLDTIEAETRFSQLFEGWVDKNADDHDDHDIHPIESHEHDDDDHDDAHDEDDHEDEEDDHEEEEDEHASEEEEEIEQASEEATEEEEEEEESAQKDDEEDEQSAPDDEDSVQQDEDDDEAIKSEQDIEEDEEDEQSRPQSEETSQELDDNASEPAQENDDDNGDDEASEADKDDNNVDDSDENDKTEAASKEKSAETGIYDNDEVEDGDESAEDGDEAGEDADEAVLGDDDVADGEEDATNAAVAIRVGVGVTILVVAYVVLVKKWKSDKVEENNKKEEAPLDLSRRNTIVVPPKVEDVEYVIDNDDEEYSEEEIEEEIKLHPKIKQDYQQLRTTYKRSLTPEIKPETLDNKSYDDEYDDEEDEDEGEYDDEEVDEEEEPADNEEEEIEDEEVEDEEVEEEEEPLSEPDDEDLMKKFEAKYGKLQADKNEEEVDEEYDDDDDEEEEDDDDEDGPYQWKRVKPSEPTQDYNSDDDRDAWLSGGPQSVYEFENFTNSDDFEVKDQLDNANQHVNNNAALAVSLFNKILDKHPKSPRALYGKAKSLDNLADQKRSNGLLKDAIVLYLEVLKLNNVPPALYITTAERCINRMRFMGHYGRAVGVHKLLMQQFPDDIKYSNQLAVTYLTINKIPEARNLLKETLIKWPNNGVALVHYGFILKVNDNNLKEAVKYLKKGLATKSEGVVDGRFYFHLGDALTRLRKLDEAAEVYKDGVENKVFLSQYQRSLYNVNRLTGRPWWNKWQTPYQQFYETLEKNYKQIRQEGLAILNQNGYFQDEAENLRDVGDWKQFELFARGIKHKENCKKCPITCKLVESLPEAVGCRRGQVKFSVMHPGTHVWPHCGPTNCRLRVHLGLKVPSNTFIRVADEIRSWEEGKVFIFDDSFEHEVWHNGSQFRLVLIVDVWHPELTIMEMQSLSAI